MHGRGVLRAALGSTAAFALLGGALASVPGTAVAGTSQASTHATADEGLLGSVSSSRSFSPNGDRVRDRVWLGIPLERRADVSVAIRRSGGGKVVRHQSLGTLRTGLRTWGWDGRNDRGRVVPDGDYRVTVTATRNRRAGRRDRDATRVSLRTTYTPPTSADRAPGLTLSRDVVHPTTPDFTDAVQITAFQWLTEWRADGSGYHSSVSHPEMEVRDPTGEVVRHWPAAEGAGNGTRPWTATDSTGAALAAGTYRLVVRLQDDYGNTGLATRPIEVSAAPLVAQRTWSTTMTAAEALTSPPRWSTSDDRDPMEVCSPSPSTRTAGALTLRSAAALRATSPECQMSQGRFAATVPFVLGPLDRLSVTMTGSEHGPDTSGTAFAGLFSTEAFSIVHTVPGDARTSIGGAFHSGGPSEQVTWFVDGGALGATDYDLERFEVDVVRYAPSS